MSSGSYPRDFRIPGGTFTEPGSMGKLDDDIRRLLKQPFRPSYGELRVPNMPFRPASERVPRSFRVPTLKATDAIRYLAGGAPGAVQKGITAILAIAKFASAQETVWTMPDTSDGYWSIAECLTTATVANRVRWDSSIYCGPLSEEMVGGIEGVGHITIDFPGTYVRHHWGFASYEVGYAEPYPWRCIASWQTGGWFEAYDPGALGWPEKWYHQNTDSYWPEAPPMPVEIPGNPDRYTYLWQGLKVITTTVPFMEPPSPPKVIIEKPVSPPDKEHKTALVIRGPTRWFFDNITELLDGLNCLWAGVPKSARSKPRWDATRHGGQGGWRHPTPQMKAMDVYQNVHNIDWGKVIECAVMNEIEDRLIGKLGQLTAKANKTRSAIAGLAFGPAL